MVGRFGDNGVRDAHVAGHDEPSALDHSEFHAERQDDPLAHPFAGGSDELGEDGPVETRKAVRMAGRDVDQGIQQRARTGGYRPRSQLFEHSPHMSPEAGLIEPHLEQGAEKRIPLRRRDRFRGGEGQVFGLGLAAVEPRQPAQPSLP